DAGAQDRGPDAGLVAVGNHGDGQADALERGAQARRRLDLGCKRRGEPLAEPRAEAGRQRLVEMRGQALEPHLRLSAPRVGPPASTDRPGKNSRATSISTRSATISLSTFTPSQSQIKRSIAPAWPAGRLSKCSMADQTIKEILQRSID